MSCRSFSSVALTLLVFFAFALQAQNPPVFTPGPQGGPLQADSVIGADLNNDGFADMVIINGTAQGNFVAVLLNNGNGTFRGPFTVHAAGPTPLALAAGDFNQDGNLDIAVVNGTSGTNGTVTILFGDGRGSFSSSQTYTLTGQANSIAAGDFNNDGRMDLAVLNGTSKVVTILTNTGSAFIASSFSVPSHFDTVNPGTAPDHLLSLVSGDFNADGKMDLFYQDSCGDSSCGPGLETYYLLTNTGEGFTPTRLSQGTTGAGELHSADLDGDGRSDIYFAFHGCHTPCIGITAFYSNGDRTFDTVSVADGSSGGDPVNVIAGDFNNDGITDIAATSVQNFNVNPGFDIYSGKGGRSGFSSAFHFDSPNAATTSPIVLGPGFIDGDGTKDFVLFENGDFIPYFNNGNTAQDPCPYPAMPGLNFCTPRVDDTGNSPVHFVASFHAQTQPANRIELWIDGQKKFQVFSDRLDITLPVSSGIHLAELVGVSANGEFIKTRRSIKVQRAPCPVPGSPGVSICDPVPDSIVNFPAHFAASAAPIAGRTITAIRIYIDNVAKATVSGNSISTDIELSDGHHSLVVVAWDNTGASYSNSESFQEVAGTAPCLPQNPGIKVCTPDPNETVQSPVGISAGAAPTAARITAMRVYVDNVAVYAAVNNAASNSQAIGVALNMASGQHRQVIVAYQSDGSALSAAENITVP